jgi:hypothetical protein
MHRIPTGPAAVAVTGTAAVRRHAGRAARQTGATGERGKYQQRYTRYGRTAHRSTMSLSPFSEWR